MSEDERAVIARVDERTQIILEMLDKLATKESVDAVARDIKEHKETHVTRGGLVATWAGIALSMLVAFVGFMRSGGPN